jgi:hypothetical protein
VDERFRDGPESCRSRRGIVVFGFVVFGDEDAFPTEHGADVQ